MPRLISDLLIKHNQDTFLIFNSHYCSLVNLERMKKLLGTKRHGSPWIIIHAVTYHLNAYLAASTSDEEVDCVSCASVKESVRIAVPFPIVANLRDWRSIDPCTGTLNGVASIQRDERNWKRPGSKPWLYGRYGNRRTFTSASAGSHRKKHKLSPRSKRGNAAAAPSTLANRKRVRVYPMTLITEPKRTERRYTSVCVYLKQKNRRACHATGELKTKKGKGKGEDEEEPGRQRRNWPTMRVQWHVQ